MYKIGFLGLIAINIFGTTFSNTAEASVLEICNKCSSQSSYYRKATSIAANRASSSHAGFNGSITVGSIKSGSVYRWNISAKWLMKGGDDPELVIRPSRQNVSPQLTNLFQQASQTEVAKAARRGIDIPGSSGLGSAFDVARGSGNHQIFDNFVHDNFPITYWTNEIANVAGEFSFAFLIGIEIQINFDDGTSIRVRMKAINTGDLSLEYVPNSAKYNESGTRIPDMGQSLEGEYHFDHLPDMQSFMLKLESMGVTFTSGGGSVKISFPNSRH